MNCFLHKIDEIIQNASTNTTITTTNKFNKFKSWTTKGLVISILFNLSISNGTYPTYLKKNYGYSYS